MGGLCKAPYIVASVMSDVELREVSKRFGEVEAVRDLSLAVRSGEFMVLLGPTGAGKTTTLRLIAGLERPDRGSVAIDGRDASREPPAARDVAFVFQQYSLYPHLTVYDNLAFPLRAPPAARDSHPAHRSRRRRDRGAPTRRSGEASSSCRRRSGRAGP